MGIKKICLAVAVMLAALMLALSGCTVEYSEDLFDEEVLKFYKISGLTKPQDAENEYYQNIGSDNKPSHLYQCDLEDYEKIYDYVTEVFDLLKSNDNTVGCFLRFKEKNTPQSFFNREEWVELEESENLSDYCETITVDEYTRYNYNFYFTTAKLKKYESEYHGQKMRNTCRVRIVFYETVVKAEEKRNFEMYVNYYDSYYAYVITDEKYLKGIKNPYINV